jgi:hypothetical protein
MASVFRISVLIPLLFLAPIVSAAAATCLSAVDGVIVEFDLPPSVHFAEGIGLHSAAAAPAGPAASEAQLSSAERAALSAGGGPQFQRPRARLTDANLVALKSALYAAQAASSRADEPACLVHLGQARIIVRTARPRD